MASNVARDGEPRHPDNDKDAGTERREGKYNSETLSFEKAQQKTNKDVYLFAARTHEAKGEFKQALDYYLKALELDPANYIVMNNIAGVYIRLKLYIEALSYSNKALDSENQLRSFPYQCRHCSGIAGQFFRRGRVFSQGRLP